MMGYPITLTLKGKESAPKVTGIWEDQDGNGFKYHHEELYEFAKEVKDFIKHQHEQAQKDHHAARKACKDCGEDEHRKKEKKCWEHVKELAKEKADAWSEIRVSYFVMDLLGVVRQFDVLDGGRDTLGCSRRIS